MTGKAIRFLAGIGLLLACSLSARAQLPAFFNGAVPLGSHWNYLQFANGHLFGYYNEQYSPDVYHNDLGWEHVIDAGDGQNGVYLYDYAGSSWFYTTPALFPTLSDFALGHSLTYQLDLKQTGHYTSNPRKFIDLSTSQLITLGPAGAAIGLLPSTPNLLSITGGGSGGGNTGHAPPGVTGSFAFTFNDAFYGANYIVGGQVSLMDGTGQNHCQLSWGRPNTLDSSDGGFCTVSLVSIVNSTSDPTAVTVTLNYTFSGAAPPGDYSVIAMVCDKDVLCSPPGTVGTWTVDGTAPPLTIMTSSLPGATAGMPYSLTLSGTGGAGNYSWSAAGLPSGLTLSAAGVLSGTASPDGVSPITVTLADGAGGRVTANYGLTVAPQSLSSVTSSQGYTYNDGVSRSSNYCLGPQGGGCYATGNSQYLQSCSVRKPDGSQLPFSSVAVTPASNTPYFSVSYNASQTMPPDSGNLTCVYQGAVIHGPAVSIYDATPHITRMALAKDLVSGGQAVAVIDGSSFGTAQGNFAFCPQGATNCNSMDLSVVPGSVTWTSSRITATLAAGAGVAGDYEVQVISSGSVAGMGFVSGGVSSAYSNRVGPVHVTFPSTLQYLTDSGYSDATAGSIYVALGTTVSFRASPSPNWSGNSGASGTGETISVLFNSQSLNANDFRAVIATTAGATLTANVVVFDFDGVLTPDDNFADRSLDTFGVGETMSLSYTTTPSVTSAQAGGFLWQVAAGAGTATDAGDGTGGYAAPASPGSFMLAFQIKQGPSKGVARKKSGTVIAPDGAYQVQKPGTGIFHVQGEYSIGFRAVTYLTPKNVSFRNIEVREGFGSVAASGYLRGADGVTHFPGVYLPVGTCNAFAGCLLSGDDTVELEVDRGPFEDGTFNLPIPREFRAVGSAGSPTQFTILTHHASSDPAGTATSTKGGAGPFTRRLNDATSTY